MALPTIAQADLTASLIGLLPRGWFSANALQKGGNTFAFLDAFSSQDMVNYNDLNAIQQQLYLTTATGLGLDNIVADYLGTDFQRKTGETDAAYLGRSMAQLLLPAGTASGLISAVQRATGETPTILEVDDFANWGCRGAGNASQVTGVVVRGSSTTSGGPGGYPFLFTEYPYQAWITVQQPSSTSTYSMPISQMYQIMASVKSLGITLWAHILPATS